VPSVMPMPRRWPGIVAALLCLASYAYFWQSRDWNAASRLMLTYALVDRHTLSIDGYEHQCADIRRNPLTGETKVRGGDIAVYNGHYYSDKAPGLSLIGALAYAALPRRAGLKPHPIDEQAMAYWAADYWVTLFSSGIATALCVYVLFRFLQLVGATTWGAFWMAIGYGLATPAFLYGTLFYGHNVAAACLLTATYALWRSRGVRHGAALSNALLAGLAAGYAVVTEYPAVGAAVLLAITAVLILRRFGPLLAFGYGAALAAAILAIYNWKAFGSPFTLSYAHEASDLFRAVHSAQSPLGLRWWEMPHFERLPELLWLPRRGLLWYAPILALSPLGLLALLLNRRHWALALLLSAIAAWYTWVVLVYPNWDGGWCTGPRLLTAIYPFLALAAGATFVSLRSTTWKLLVVPVVLAGMAINLGCVAVGGRFPPSIEHPLKQVVLPRWQGKQSDGLRTLAGGAQFERNLGRQLARWVKERWLGAGHDESNPEQTVQDRLRVLRRIVHATAQSEWSPWRPLEFAPLVLLWCVALVMGRANDGNSGPTGAGGG